MKSSSMQLIERFLATKPRGATGHEIAEHVGVSLRIAAQSLVRLLEHSQVKRAGNGSRFDDVWSLAKFDVVAPVATPPIFRAKETLRGMQEAGRRQLAATPVLEAA
ncbi:hypothetical protein [Paraburkholderia caffeinilytica]|uniref:hypothetical protein n=1 Tax=Paraburkholderia caffeinilytica TaxID=1761016 RepID=UPI0038B82A33